MKKMTQKRDSGTLNEEIEPKIGIYEKNWARLAPLKNFDLRQQQRSTDPNVIRVDVATW